MTLQVFRRSELGFTFVEMPVLTVELGWKEVKSFWIAAWEKRGGDVKTINLGRMEEGSETTEPA